MKFLPSLQSQTLIDEYRLPLNRGIERGQYSSPLVKVKAGASITDRLLAGDKTAVPDCVDKYGALIWTMVRKYTASASAAESAAEGIFVEIWKWAVAGQMSSLSEKNIIIQIAAKCLAELQISHRDKS